MCPSDSCTSTAWEAISSRPLKRRTSIYHISTFFFPALVVSENKVVVVVVMMVMAMVMMMEEEWLRNAHVESERSR